MKGTKRRQARQEIKENRHLPFRLSLTRQIQEANRQTHFNMAYTDSSTETSATSASATKSFSNQNVQIVKIEHFCSDKTKHCA